jgi:hypothetical protein
MKLGKLKGSEKINYAIAKSSSLDQNTMRVIEADSKRTYVDCPEMRSEYQ